MDATRADPKTAMLAAVLTNPTSAQLMEGRFQLKRKFKKLRLKAESGNMLRAYNPVPIRIVPKTMSAMILNIPCSQSVSG